MRRIVIIAMLGIFVASSASAQLPGLRKRDTVAQPVLQGIDALRAEFVTRSGTDTIYFGADSVGLAAPARATLAAQAQWLRQHPEVIARIDGHGEPNDTRDHAVAMGARRAQGVRDYLVLLGVPGAQLTISSFGKERPGAPRAVTVLVR